MVQTRGRLYFSVQFLHLPWTLGVTYHGASAIQGDSLYFLLSSFNQTIISLIRHALPTDAWKQCASFNTFPISAGFSALTEVPSLSMGPLLTVSARKRQD